MPSARNFAVPLDARQPQWEEASRVHDWKNYINTSVQVLWPTFSAVQQDALAQNADELANKEHWE